MNMDLATLLAFTVMYWAGYFSRMYWARRAERRERPYRFVCEEEGCYFRASSSEAGILIAVQHGHLNDHAEKKRRDEALYDYAEEDVNLSRGLYNLPPINSCRYIMPDGSRCLQESCAAIHMTHDGHDFKPSN